MCPGGNTDYEALLIANDMGPSSRGPRFYENLFQNLRKQDRLAHSTETNSLMVSLVPEIPNFISVAIHGLSVFSLRL